MRGTLVYASKTDVLHTTLLLLLLLLLACRDGQQNSNSVANSFMVADKAVASGSYSASLASPAFDRQVALAADG